MRIKLYWPECNYLNGKWVVDGEDSFWIECTYEEAEKNIFHYLSPEQIKASMENWEPKEIESKDTGIDTNCLCYLVSKDLRSIIPLKWYYPYSGQWNAFCPFKEIRPIETKELKDLCDINVEIS